MSGMLIQQWKGDSTADSQLQLWNSSLIPCHVPNSLTLAEFWLLKCDTDMRKLNSPRMGFVRSDRRQLGPANIELVSACFPSSGHYSHSCQRGAGKESAHRLSITQWRGPRQVPSIQPHSLQCMLITNLCTA